MVHFSIEGPENLRGSVDTVLKVGAAQYTPAQSGGRQQGYRDLQGTQYARGQA